MLSSPVFANPHPRLASPPSDLRVLSALCVKIPPSVDHDRPESPQTSPHSAVVYYPKGAGSRTLKHQNEKSAPLFSIACALFCNYGGGGVYPSSGAKLSLSSLCLSLDPRHHTQVLSFHTLANSFAMEKSTTPLFSDGSKLFKKNTRVGGGSSLSSSLPAIRETLHSHVQIASLPIPVPKQNTTRPVPACQITPSLLFDILHNNLPGDGPHER
jgi:hypothetical protein